MLPLGLAELIRKPRSSAHGDHAMSRCGSARTGQMILHVWGPSHQLLDDPRPVTSGRLFFCPSFARFHSHSSRLRVD